MRNATLQDSLAGLSDNLHLKETIACLVVSFLSDLCMPCVVFLCFVVLYLSCCFVFSLFVLLCLSTVLGVSLFLFWYCSNWSLLPNHETPAMCSVLSGSASSIPLNIINFPGYLRYQ